MLRTIYLRLPTIALLAFLLLTTPPAFAEDGDVITLPPIVAKHSPIPLAKVGQGLYRKFGFRIYNAALWAPEGSWDGESPYALQLNYTHSLSKETLIDTVMDDIEEQNIADDATRARWRGVLDTALRDVEDGDILTGLSLPDKEKAILFLNEAVITTIDEKTFSDAFFSIWLGEHANEDLREDLLGGTRIAQNTP